jgi:diacylglycerol kinase family enzyme
LEAAHFDVTHYSVPGARVGSTVARWLGDEPTLVVVGGGDGSLRTVAGLLVDTPHVLGVLPLGTMNRFARSMGIPTALDAAAQTLIDGDDHAIDLGEANGEVFLNSCVIGLYPELARAREANRAKHSDWPRFVRWCVDTATAAWQVLGATQLIRFRMRLGQHEMTRKVPTILISNNPLPDLGQRRHFDKGVLAIYIPRGRHLLEDAWVALRAAVLGPAHIQQLDELLIEDAVLETFQRIPIALDGEVKSVPSSVHLRSRPRACRVRAPRRLEEPTP